MPGAASDATSPNRLPDGALCRMSRPCDAATRSGFAGRMLGASDSPVENSKFGTSCDGTAGEM